MNIFATWLNSNQHALKWWNCHLQSKADVGRQPQPRWVLQVLLVWVRLESPFQPCPIPLISGHSRLCPGRTCSVHWAQRAPAGQWLLLFEDVSPWWIGLSTRLIFSSCSLPLLMLYSADLVRRLIGRPYLTHFLLTFAVTCKICS